MKKLQKKHITLVLFFLARFLLQNVFLHSEQINFSADNMKGKTTKSQEETMLIGNAYILTNTMEINADSITLKGKDFRYIFASGNISGKNLETNMEFTCGELSFDRKTKLATLKDNVKLVDKENDIVAKAQIIEYDQDTDIAIIQIDITLTQKDNECHGAYAMYKKKQKLLELSGNAQIKQKEDTFRAQEITLNLDTQEITLDGRVKGSVTDSGQEQNQNTNAQNQNDETQNNNDKNTNDENQNNKSESEQTDE
ncbi:MAG: LPS export ABC transporter periplasmic protein LptC [Treponema sp.]|nr:LPS export ABC transporter periplasmic protein LptC [Treponema sp.]